MAASRAPKQWSLTRNETITTFEAWRQNLQYTLSLDPNFARFLVDGFTWQKKTNATPLRGLTDDGGDVAEAARRTAAQKCTHLELMLGQIANYCPIISRNSIVKNSTSVKGVWQAIRLHFGFQTSGSHFLDFNNIRLEPNERPEDLYQRLTSFVEDNLLHADGSIQHHGEVPAEDEELTPTLENLIVLTWLRLIHPELPALVKQRYGTELRLKTLASLKPEISMALDSLLDEVHSLADAKVLRASFKNTHKNVSSDSKKRSSKSCVLCKQAGRHYQHYLSTCKYLPEKDRKYMTKVCLALPDDNNSDSEDDNSSSHLEFTDDEPKTQRIIASSRRVSTKQSPFFRAFYKHHPLQLILDTGAEVSMMRASTAQYIGATITKSKQSALQADGVTPLQIVGETHIILSREGIDLYLEALIVSDLDVDILAGIPFMTHNDISVRPAKQQIEIKGCSPINYGPSADKGKENRVRRTQAFVLRAKNTTVWPGSYIEFDTPPDFQHDCSVAIEPRTDSIPKGTNKWPQPQVTEAIAGKIRLFNDTCDPQQLQNNDHVCQVLSTYVPYPYNFKPSSVTIQAKKQATVNDFYSDSVKLDPDNILTTEHHGQFQNLLRKYDDVFSPDLKGYNGSVGPFEAVVNMGPVEPPQRKGRIPQYSRNRLVELQAKFDELEQQGVFRRPEDIGITAEYLNPSFLVKKPSGGFRLVTAFAEVGQYSKPQPSLMPDVDSILRTIGQWKYIIVSDLSNAFYQIPLSKKSMKYCGVATPFRGIRVYTKCAMGMPGSETALEELMCRVLGDCLQDGCVAKLADDLYCGGNTLEELLTNWSRVLQAMYKSNLHLSPSKTIICPRSTTILGWVWTDGQISASPHKVAVLSTCSPPDNVRGMRAFIGAFKMLSRVLPQCSSLLSPLDKAISGLDSHDKIIWTDMLLSDFKTAQQSLKTNRSITIPKCGDKLWIVTDGSVSKRGIGATLYVNRNDKLILAGFFSAKLRKHQVTWLPCEIEALCIGASVKHFAPFIIQSEQQTSVLTDSKPCVQAVDKLCRGEFSASPRVTSFLSIVSRYQVSVHHLSGSANIPSDFASRNAPDCNELRCQVCSFITQLEDSVVRSISVQDVIDNIGRLPFTSRAAWKDVQSECPDLRRTMAHLKQGTRPSKKLTTIKDIKRYLSVATISRDGLLVVRRNDPLLPPADLIIVPRNVLDGLITALHIRLDHPSKHQLQLVMKRHFYALDLPKTIERVHNTCHTCASLMTFPNSLIKQTSEDPPESIGINFAADVLKRSRQLILLLRETVTSYTAACIIQDEKRVSLREGLIRLIVGLHPLDGPAAVVRVDPAPGFVSLKNDESLNKFNVSLQIGRVKNSNKNPVAERGIAELEAELLRHDPSGGAISDLDLAICVARLNSRIRSQGLSSRELWTQRNQFTHEQIPISDHNIILNQHNIREKNHPFSETSKCQNPSRNSPKLLVGNLVYLYSDKTKSKARNRYIIVSIDGDWCFIKKFVGNQLRATSYKVKLSECYRVHSDIQSHNFTSAQGEDDTDVMDNVESFYEPTSIPTLLSVPLENFEATSTNMTDPNDLPDTTEHNMIQQDAELEQPPPSQRTSQRPRKLPGHLKDFVLY